MTNEQLLAYGDSVLDTAIKQLLSDGDSPIPVFHLIGPSKVDVIGVDPSMMDTGQSKDRVAATVTSKLAERGDVEAVIWVSDVFTGRAFSDEAHMTMQRLHLNVEQAYDLGLCTKEEAIIVLLESLTINHAWTQRYERCGSGRQIKLLDRLSNEAGMDSGRFAHLLRKGQAARSAAHN